MRAKIGGVEEVLRIGPDSAPDGREVEHYPGLSGVVLQTLKTLHQVVRVLNAGGYRVENIASDEPTAGTSVRLVLDVQAEPSAMRWATRELQRSITLQRAD